MEISFPCPKYIRGALVEGQFGPFSFYIRITYENIRNVKKYYLLESNVDTTFFKVSEEGTSSILSVEKQSK
jgi:hypothetical protein